jgi:hypothetical protein
MNLVMLRILFFVFAVFAVLVLMVIVNPGLIIGVPTNQPRLVGATVLRSGIHEAQKIFKERIAFDQNENQIGEYGLLSDMTSDSMQLLPAFFKGKNPEHGSFYFSLYLPDGKGGSLQ